MRPVGFTLAAFLFTAPMVTAQAPVPLSPTAPPGTTAPIATPGTGIAPGQPVAAPAAVDPRIVQHLNGWEQAIRGATNFRADFDIHRTEATFGKTTEHSGSVLCMKPNLARLRLQEKPKPGTTPDPKNPLPYEAFICSGKAIFHYDGTRKTMTQHIIDPAVAANGDNLMLDFLSGMRAEAAMSRFDISLPKDPDAHYVYFLIKPRLPRDRQEFEEVRFAIYGPNLPEPHKKMSYLPAQVFVKKPNGDTEVWKFRDMQTNLPGVEPKHFQYEAPPKDWTIQQAPPSGIGAAPMK